MSHCGKFLFAALLALAQATAQQQQPPPQFFAINGLVVRPQTNQPVKKAHVTITRNDHRDQQATVITGEDGSFHFTDVPAGKYTLSAESHGVNKTFLEDAQYSTGIAVGPGLDSGHIVFPLSAPTSLTVEILDEQGEPVRNAQVMLFRRHIEAGWAQVQLLRQQNSDEDGRCRWAHLEAGTYFAAAGGRPWYAQSGYAQSMMGAQSPESEAATKELDVAFPTTYYPAAANPQEASPIQIVDGDESKIRITLRTVPAVRITIDEGVALSNTSMSVETLGPAGIRFQANSFFFSNNQSSEIRGLAPGTYLVSRFIEQPGSASSSGTALVSVNGDTPLSASSFQKTEINGRLVVEGGKTPAGLMLLLSEPETNENSICQVQRDGIFHCNRGGPGGDFSPGKYQLHLLNTGSLYIKSIAAQGAAYTDGLLHVSHGASVQLAITAAPGLTKLDGIALRNGKPYPAAMVLLIPQPVNQGNGIPRDQSDSDGTFTLPEVHPGRYFLLAIDHGRDLEYHNPKVLAPYLAHAETVEVPANGAGVVQVNVQPRLKP